MKKILLASFFVLVPFLVYADFLTGERYFNERRYVDAFNELPSMTIPKSQIPKVIHYVWLGSKELPPMARKCVESWQKYLPDFELKRWDEKNCDINSNPFMKEAYEKKRYDFASDYCRVKALQEGGIYFDTDMLLKSEINELLDEPLVLTLQRVNDLSASFMAVIPNHPFVMALKKDYENRQYFDDFEIYNAPSTWTRIFWNLFQENLNIGRKNGKYRIVAPNILMYDFKGGENRAEHLFGAGTKDAQQSVFYHWFRKIYLQQFAFYIIPEDKYFILKNDEEGYFYDTKENCSSMPFRYALKDKMLEIKNPTGLRSFLCLSEKCDEM